MMLNTKCDPSALQQILCQGLQNLNISLAEEKQIQLIAYIVLLVKWNKAYNLTAVREPSQMIFKHLLDCLAVLPHLPLHTSVLDVGTGAGLPGLVLSIARPQQHFTLLDSSNKRMMFLHKVIRELHIENVSLVESRTEKYHPENPFDLIISRAFSSLKDFIDLTHHFANSDTIYLAMKGKYPAEELATLLPQNIILEKFINLVIPGIEGERHLLQLKQRPPF